MTTDNIRVLKTGTCPSLSGKSQLTFEVGADDASTIFLRINENTGSGAFSKDWVALNRAANLLEKTAGAITSHSGKPDVAAPRDQSGARGKGAVTEPHRIATRDGPADGR